MRAPGCRRNHNFPLHLRRPGVTLPRRPHSEGAGMREALGRGWECLRDVWRILFPMRFSIVVLVIAGPFLGLSQSQDTLLALVRDDGIGHKILFPVACFVWAFYTFYWARFMSRLPFPAL